MKLRVVVATIALLFASSGNTLAAQVINVQRSVWPGEQAQSPKFAVGKFGIDFNATPARSQDGPTIALFIAAQVPASYERVYGGRITGAINIIAVSTSTGKTYRAVGERVDAPPLTPTLKSNGVPDSEKTATSNALSAWVNVDLRSHLQLPSTADQYFVFLWLDDVLSTVRRVSLPTATTGLVKSPGINEGLIVARWSQPSVGAAQVKGISLTSLPSTLRGVLAASVAKNSRSVQFMTLNFNTRDIRIQRIDLPRNDDQQLDVDQTVLLPGDARDRTFLIAFAGGSVSNVVVMEGRSERR